MSHQLMLCCSGTQVSGVPLLTQVTHHFLVFIYLPKNVPGSFVSRIRRFASKSLQKTQRPKHKSLTCDGTHSASSPPTTFLGFCGFDRSMRHQNTSDENMVHLSHLSNLCCLYHKVFTVHKGFGGNVETYQNLSKPMNLKDLPRCSLSRSHDQVGSFQHST